MKRQKINERNFDFYDDGMEEAKKLAGEGNFSGARLLIGRMGMQLQDYKSYRYSKDKAATILIMEYSKLLTETSDEVEKTKRKQIRHLRLTDEESRQFCDIMNERTFLDRTTPFNLRTLGEVNILPSVRLAQVDGEPTRYVIFYQGESEGRIYGGGEEFMVETFGGHNN